MHSTDQKTSRGYVAASMRERLGNHPRLTARLVPKFALRCRRMTPGSHYLQSLRADNIEFITHSAVELTTDGCLWCVWLNHCGGAEKSKCLVRLFKYEVRSWN